MMRGLAGAQAIFAASVANRLTAALFLLYWLTPSLAEAQVCTATIGASNFATIQAAVNAAGTGATILVSGTCNENVSINERKEGITLNGQGAATVNGPSATAATIGVRGRGTTIEGFTITGGQNGVQVFRGGTATIDGNIIQGAASGGVLVNQSGYAVVVNNLIQNNLGNGIVVDENSSARIGFVGGQDVTASPNVIQNNGTRGILVIRASNARIVGNTINNNGDDGIGSLRDSQASASNNLINNNAGDGIFVTQNSGVNLGNDTGTTIFDLPNSTTSNNSGFGVRCTTNSYANGRLGSINGVSGPTSFTASCINSLIP
jgi:parallel beta helix pectate lyase-like protein